MGVSGCRVRCASWVMAIRSNEPWTEFTGGFHNRSEITFQIPGLQDLYGQRTVINSSNRIRISRSTESKHMQYPRNGIWTSRYLWVMKFITSFDRSPDISHRNKTHSREFTLFPAQTSDFNTSSKWAVNSDLIEQLLEHLLKISLSQQLLAFKATVYS